MERRRIQLIAGTTYSISLPKDWIRKHNLKEKKELTVSEESSGSLLLTPGEVSKMEIKRMRLNIKDYLENIDQILFALYYLGIEEIEIFSKSDMDKQLKSKIRKTFSHMSGAEISYEDKCKIILRILLDKSKVNLNNLIYRIGLVINLSIENILEKIDKKEIELNEDEIDRLYHLASKIISLSLIDNNILRSSEINNIILVPSYFLICKKLENLGDEINRLAMHLSSKKKEVQKCSKYLEFMKDELDRSVKHIIKGFPDSFKKFDEDKKNLFKKNIFELEDKIMGDYLKNSLRYLRDIEDEIIQISFNISFIKNKYL